VAQHLTQAQIDGYVSRKAPVDDILLAAHHLDECADCRDRAAAIVDDGSARRMIRNTSLAKPMAGAHRVMIWTIVGILVVAVAVVVILYRP